MVSISVQAERQHSLAGFPEDAWHWRRHVARGKEHVADEMELSAEVAETNSSLVVGDWTRREVARNAATSRGTGLAQNIDKYMNQASTQYNAQHGHRADGEAVTSGVDAVKKGLKDKKEERHHGHDVDSHGVKKPKAGLLEIPLSAFGSKNRRSFVEILGLSKPDKTVSHAQRERARAAAAHENLALEA